MSSHQGQCSSFWDYVFRLTCFPPKGRGNRLCDAEMTVATVSGCVAQSSLSFLLRYSAQISGFCFLKAQSVIGRCTLQTQGGSVSLLPNDSAHIYTRKITRADMSVYHREQICLSRMWEHNYRYLHCSIPWGRGWCCHMKDVFEGEERSRMIPSPPLLMTWWNACRCCIVRCWSFIHILCFSPPSFRTLGAMMTAKITKGKGVPLSFVYLVE